MGKWGEALAADYLIARGCQIVGRNIRTPYGEIDLLAIDGDQTVFVEVKTRTTGTFGAPEVSVTPRKQAHMQAAAEAYLVDHPEMETSWRIDVIAIYGRPGDPAPEIVCFENAIS